MAYYDDGKRYSNITRFGLELFRRHYRDDAITADDIFHYTYAMFNDLKYSEKYGLDLQRHFPRIQLAENFRKWAAAGKTCTTCTSALKTPTVPAEAHGQEDR